MKRLATAIPLACGVALALAAAGCNTQAKWTYPLDAASLYHASAEPTRLTVAVLPFEEERPVLNRSATFLIYMIPVVPFGWVTYERPEAARMFNTIAQYDMQLDEDLAKAATRSFEESKLFDRVYFTFGGETREADLILRGSARHTTYDGKIYSYGLSVFGPALWFIGLPAGSSRNVLDIALSLTDRDNRELWSYAFDGDESITQGLYYNWGNDALHFASLFQAAMNGALEDLAQELPRIRSALDATDR